MKNIYTAKNFIRGVGLISIGGLLSACGSSPVNQTQHYSQQQVQAEYRQQEKAVSMAINEAPPWMYKLPKEPGVIYENGTAISSDFSMADLKAKTMAYVKICTGAGGKVRSQMKMYRTDNDANSSEQSELAVRSLCPDVDISGVETVEMKHVAEGTRVRTYVLVALPVGQKNSIRSTKEMQNRSGEAFKELDGITKEQAPTTQITPVPAAIPMNGAKTEAINNPPVSQVELQPDGITPQLNQDLKMNGRPSSKTDGDLLNSVKVVRPDSVIVQSPDGAQKKVDLIGSKNPEYVARRNEALNKPGAVIGQTSVE